MRKVYGWSLVGVICTCAGTWAQAPDDPPRTKVRPAPAAAPGTVVKETVAGTVGRGTADQEIAAVLWSGAHGEVELGKVAQQQAQADAVKEFAAKMIKDHTQQADKLARLAGQFAHSTGAHSESGVEIRREGRKTPKDGATREDDRKKDARDDRREGSDETKATNDREKRRENRDANREERSEGREGRTTSITAVRSGLNWVEIHREIGQQCLESAKKELTSKTGAEFDMCYMSMQVGAHMHMLDQLQVLKNHATSELQQNIEQDIATTEQHLTEAKQILNQIKDNASKGK